MNKFAQIQRVKVSPIGLQEIVDGRSLVTISKDDIVGISVTYGRVSETPILLLLAGLTALGLGYIGLALLSNGKPLRLGGAMFAISVFAPFCFYAALRRGAVCIVETRLRSRRLGFGSPISADELKQFEQGCREFLQRAVTMQLPPAKSLPT
jgi:hypothetical protein